MITPDDAADTTGSIERLPRRFNHRDYLAERRQHILQQKHTDALPALPGDTTPGKTILRQLVLLREENMRLQQQVIDADKEIEAIHNGHLQEIENYQEHIKGLIAERDVLQEQYLQAEQHYQELYNNFQNTVETEAFRMLTEATSTIELPPESDAPTLQEDLRKTVELHIRQVEDQHTAQALYLARQAQRKAAQLEEQLAKEREQIAQEREKLSIMQNTLREQAEQRRRTIDAHLRAKFFLSLTMIAFVSFTILALAQLFLTDYLHISLLAALFISVVVCVIAAGIIASIRSSLRTIVTSVPHKDVVKK